MDADDAQWCKLSMNVSAKYIVTLLDFFWKVLILLREFISSSYYCGMLNSA